MLTLPTTERLSRIETIWTLVFDAHNGASTDGAARDARHDLLARYGDAILRYLTGAFRDEVAAQDTFQEFAIRLLKGDYKNASPDRGRFRGFLKTVLSRLVADHYRKRTRRRESPLEADASFFDQQDQLERESEFQMVWRDELLTVAWQRLAQEESRTGRPWMTVLRLRVELPQLCSAELAQALGQIIGEDVNATRLRVILHRSREKFANFLIDAVAESLSIVDGSQNHGSASALAEVEQELADLELLQYCQSVVQQRRDLNEKRALASVG